METTHFVVNPLWCDHGILSNQEGVVVYPDLDLLIEQAQKGLVKTLDSSQIFLYVSPQIPCDDSHLASLQSSGIAPKAVVSTGTGINHIQISAEKQKELSLVINSMPYRSRYHTVLVTLSLLDYWYGTELRDQHIRIVGTGVIGKWLQDSLDWVAKKVVSYSTRDEQFTQQIHDLWTQDSGDIVILCASLQDHNKDMLTEDILTKRLAHRPPNKPLTVMNIGRAEHIHASCYPVINAATTQGILRRYSDVEPHSIKYFDQAVILNPSTFPWYPNSRIHQKDTQIWQQWYQQNWLPVLSHKLMGTTGAMIQDPSIKQAYEEYMISRMKQLGQDPTTNDTQAVTIPRSVIKKYPFLQFLYWSW